jgi:hypothetical protein
MSEEVKFRLGNVFPEKKVETMELKGVMPFRSPQDP